MNSPASPAPDMEQQLSATARRLAQGGLVAFPTETVYGMGADAEKPQALASIYAAKGRQANHTVIVHLAPAEIGRASCRERVCTDVEISEVAVPIKKKMHNS